MPDAPRFAFRPDEGSDFLELPVTTVRFGDKNFPCGGGGFFRLFPYALSRWALRRVNGRDAESAIFYFHPWEIDPDQPRQQGLNFNLRRTEGRLRRLASDFRWGRMDQVFLHDREAGR